jgi:hypothetical protein
LLKLVMCPLLVLPLPRAFLLRPLTVLTRQTRQEVHHINQSICLRCLWYKYCRCRRVFKITTSQTKASFCYFSSIFATTAPHPPSSNFLFNVCAGNTKGGSITVWLTSCLTGLESAVRLLTSFVFICKTD